jgi:transposase
MNYVGLDVHKEYCQAAILDEQGKLVEQKQIQTSEQGFKQLAKAIDKGSSIVMEASCSFYTPYDYFSGRGYTVKVAHPANVKAIASSKVKTDKIDAKILADLLRAELIPETYVPNKSIRQLRDLLVHRQGLVKMRTEAKNRIHAVLTKRGIRYSFTDLFGKSGTAWLNSLDLGLSGNLELAQSMDAISLLNAQIAKVEDAIYAYEKSFPETRLLQTMPGIGRLVSMIMLAEIANIDRFSDEKKLANYAGLTPSVHQSGDVNRHGRITKQGSKMLRTAMIQAAQRAMHKDTKIRRFYLRVQKRHGNNKAKVAVARKMLCWSYIMLKRGEPFSA